MAQMAAFSLIINDKRVAEHDPQPSVYLIIRDRTLP